MAMSQRHKDALTKNRVNLVKHLIVDELFLSYMMEKKIITESMKEDIETNLTTQKKVGKLLEIIVRRGPEAMSVLIKAMVYTDQEHISDLLDHNLSAMSVAERDAERNEPTVDQIDYPDEPMVEKSLSEKLEDIKNNRDILAVESRSCDPKTIARLMKDIGTHEVYTVSGQKRGRAVIISNCYFSKPRLQDREGNECDVDNLQRLFDKLGFTVVTYGNMQSNEEIYKCLEREKTNVEHKTADMFVLCALSHGEDGHFFAMDGSAVSIKQIIDMFDGKQCPALSGKPKMFFIQACRGKSSSTGCSIDSTDDVDGAVQFPESRSMTPSSSSSDLQTYLHEKYDVLIGRSTISGYTANRNILYGSLYIRCLVYVFSRKAHTHPVMDMLTEVTNIMSIFKTEKNELFACDKQDSLRKKVFFMPGFTG